jgi:hypothetical protein
MDATNTELRRRLEALERQVAALLAIRPRTARDEQDALLRRTIATVTKGRPFTANQLMMLAGSDAGLGEVVSGTTIQSSYEMGSWLRDRAGCSGGVIIERTRGRKWIAATIQ